MTRLQNTPLRELLETPPRYGINAPAAPFTGFEYSYIRITDIDEQSRFAPDPRVAVLHPDAPRYILKEGDVVVARTGASVGKSYLYDAADGELVFAGFLICLSVDRSRLNPKYLSIFMQTKQYWDWISQNSVRSGQPGVNGREYGSLPIPTVPIEEQYKIADIFDSVDRYINLVESTITKKRDIKQGVMQQLLTGRIRLPGFVGDFSLMNIYENSTVKARIGWQGLKKSEYLSQGNYRLVGGTDFIDGAVNWSTVSFVDKWRYDQDKNIQLKVDDILITKDGSIGKTALVRKLPGAATLNSGVFVLRPKNQAYLSRYLFYMLQSSAFEEFINNLSAGSTISYLYQKDLATLKLKLPPTIEEQKAIADILDGLNDELALLEQKLAKIKDIKQGMMQQLLTGRVRLPETEEAKS